MDSPLFEMILQLGIKTPANRLIRRHLASEQLFQRIHSVGEVIQGELGFHTGHDFLNHVIRKVYAQ